MKILLLVIGALLLITWAVMFFVLKTGEVAYIVLAVAGITILFRYSLRNVLS